jgi:PST family polysaccharide transporter
MLVSFFFLAILVFSFEKFSKDTLVYFLTFGTVIGKVLFPNWYFQGIEQMKYITYINVSIKSFFTLLIFVLVHEQADFYIVPILISLGFIISGSVGLITVFVKYDIVFKFQHIDTLILYLKDGYQIFISQFAINIYRTTNIFVLGLVTNNTIVGYYAIAEKILTAIQNLQVPVGNALFPNVSKKFSNNLLKQNISNLLHYSKYFVLVYLGLTLITLLFASELILLISGEYIAQSALNLQIISFVILIGGMNYYFGVLGLIPLKYDKFFTNSVLTVAFLNAIIIFPLTYIFQDIGASFSLLFSETLLLLLLCKKIIHIKQGLKK